VPRCGAARLAAAGSASQPSLQHRSRSLRAGVNAAPLLRQGGREALQLVSTRLHQNAGVPGGRSACWCDGHERIALAVEASDGRSELGFGRIGEVLTALGVGPVMQGLPRGTPVRLQVPSDVADQCFTGDTGRLPALLPGDPADTTPQSSRGPEARGWCLPGGRSRHGCLSMRCARNHTRGSPARARVIVCTQKQLAAALGRRTTIALLATPPRPKRRDTRP